MARRLVVCCDGTWNQAQSRTHIWRISGAVAPRGHDGVEQIPKYFEGVGTSFGERIRGGVFGQGLSENIIKAYTWLVETYLDGDEIFCFGFSRGAYTARSLCGFIAYAGLLRPDQRGLIDEAYDAYRKQGEERERSAFHRRRAELRREVRIRFLGVFDTVGALGVPFPWAKKLPASRRIQFHDTRLSGLIDRAYHAVGIDERRAPYEPTMWTNDRFEGQEAVEQVWFPGVHSDIGGGYPDSKTLADVPLAWMLDRAAEAGLKVDPGRLDPPLNPERHGPIHESMNWAWKAAHWLSISLAVRPRPIGNRQREAAKLPPDKMVRIEAIHEAAFDRIGGDAAAKLPDRPDQKPYRPKNIVNDAGEVRDDVRGVPRVPGPPSA